MGSLSDVTLGEIVRALARYRPVALTVLAIAAFLVVVPGPHREAVRDLAQTGAVAGAPVAENAAAESTASVEESGVDAFSSTTFTSTVSSEDTFTFSSDDSSTSFDEFDFSSSGGSSDFTFSDPDFSSSSSAEPLHVVGKAWATATAGTPLASTGVPPGTLPVGTRVGRDDKLSFVRLEGDETVLRLSEDPNMARATAAPAVVACMISDSGWADAEAMSFSQAPKYDPALCVVGQRDSTGVWSFDLSGAGTPNDPHGWALVPPSSNKPIDFQVNFKPA